MALATQCPHCHTTFRVAADQLKLRGGIVRCGACQSIFDGNAHLIDLDALAAKPEPPAAVAPAAEEAATQPRDGESGPPVHTLDVDRNFDPPGMLPKPAPASAESSPSPRAQVWRNGGMMAAAAAAAVAPETHPEAEQEATPDADAVVDTVPPMRAVELDTAPPVPDAEPELPPAEPDLPTTEHAAASAYAPHGRVEPSFELPVDEELVAQPLPGDEHAYQDEAPAGVAAVSGSAPEIPPTPLPLRASAGGIDTVAPPLSAPAPTTESARAKAVEARTRRSKLTPTNIEAPKLRVPVGAEADEPEFIKRSRKQEQSGRTRRLLMSGGAVVLGLLLLAQGILDFRNVLAARYPGARPFLATGCAVLGCRVGLPAQIENLSIETGELSTLGVDTYSLNTLLRNQGSLVQAWPSIQLELADANDKPVLRRVFGPADYLPRGLSAANGFAARSEQPVRLNFALTELKPSGYHIAVFYP